MTGRIIPLHGDDHHQVQLLLPWYVTGRLEPTEHARVEAHLGVCQDCQAELIFERQLDAEVADLPLEVERDWARMRRRIDPGASPQAATEAAPATFPGRRPRTGGRWLGWAVAAQITLVVLVGGLVASRTLPARYQTLGAPAQAAPGNIIVIFRPDISERALRLTLRANDARLVDGPTPADAYVLHVPAARRAAVLADLRARPEIVLAQPIGDDGPP